MNEESDLLKIANEALQLEYNVSKLYLIFRYAFPDDADFWWRLVLEENNHAALIKSGRDHFIPEGVFPHEIFPSMDELKKANKVLLSLLDKYENSPPTRKEAFNLALKTELSAGEIHFQRTMTKSTDSKVLNIFQKLNQDDKDHAKRIRAYMKQEGILESNCNSKD